jgi:hypothetical protein
MANLSVNSHQLHSLYFRIDGNLFDLNCKYSMLFRAMADTAFESILIEYYF